MMEDIKVYVTERRGHLHLCWKNEAGKTEYKSCRTDDPVQAEIQRRKFEEKLRRGVTDPYETHRYRPLLEHLQDYYDYMRATGTEMRAKHVRVRATRVLEESGMKLISDLTPNKVNMALSDMRKRPQKRNVPREDWPKICAQTRNEYRRAIKQFVKWMQVDRRIPDFPLIGLKCENVAMDQRHARRAFTDDEFSKLIKAASDSTKVIEGLSGADRVRIYLVAYATGFRRGEIASLRKSSFDFTCDPPTVSIEAAYSKHRRRDQLPLHPDIVPKLRDWLRGMKGSELLFPGLEIRKTFKFIKADLKAAGVAYRDSAGKYADFHSLRHTFITRAWSSGATADVVRSLARHQDITMTMRYTHATPAAQATAMQNMPRLPGLPK